MIITITLPSSLSSLLYLLYCRCNPTFQTSVLALAAMPSDQLLFPLINIMTKPPKAEKKSHNEKENKLHKKKENKLHKQKEEEVRNEEPDEAEGRDRGEKYFIP
ncbi:hypothetical protein F5B17DRAFT_260737 [Nemania serpens]|nr:hypothetical protein F5B17DRAFT_260737 [Nemania serpens]